MKKKLALEYSCEYHIHMNKVRFGSFKKGKEMTKKTWIKKGREITRITQWWTDDDGKRHKFYIWSERKARKTSGEGNAL